MFFLCSKTVIIATPDMLPKSEKTIDMTAEELAQNYDIQIKAKLATAILTNPDFKYTDPIPPS